MNSVKYIGLDVHRTPISVAVLNAEGKLVMQCMLAHERRRDSGFSPRAAGDVACDLRRRHALGLAVRSAGRRVAQVVVCNPRKNALLKAGNKSDRDRCAQAGGVVAGGLLSPVYHGENSTARGEASGPQLSGADGRHHAGDGAAESAVSRPGDCLRRARSRTGRVIARVAGAVDRSGLHRRAETLPAARCVAAACGASTTRSDRWSASKHSATKLLRTIPWLGPIRAALLIGRVQTPHRFRTKRQFWAYCGLALETRSSAEYRFVDWPTGTAQEAGVHPRAEPQPQSRSEKPVQERGHRGQRPCGTVQRVLRKPAGQGDEAGDGATDAGAQDRRHHSCCVEERRCVRRRISEATSSLSARRPRKGRDSLCVFGSAAERSGSRVSILRRVRQRHGAKSHGAPYAPSDNPTKL